MGYILLLLLTSTTISYLILKLIYRKAFKSKKKISKFLTFLGSIGLIIFYYTPYSFYLEPSYWQFRNMCKINELPNNDEKYNKILSYFDTDLERLDWERLNKRKDKMGQDNGWYKQGKLEYIANDDWKTQGRIEMTSWFFSDISEFNKNNIQANYFSVVWHSRRYFLKKESMTSYNYIWDEGILGCSDILKENMTPKGIDNDK